MKHLIVCAALFAFTSGCKYDLDKLYEHSISDAAVNPDSRDAAIDAGPVVPRQLIDLFGPDAHVDADCRACVVKRCAAKNDACREDDNCTRATRCFAETINPDAHATCRSEQLDWFRGKLDERALGGPFYLCAFRDECKSECEAAKNWACLGKYSFGTTSADSVNLELHLFEARTGDDGANIRINVCAPEDLACSAPQNPMPFISDAKGAVTVRMPTPLRAFRGYLDLQGAGWYPTLVHFGWPMARDGVLRFGIVNSVNTQLSIAAAMVEPDDTRGLLQIRMFGCAGVGMEGVSFTASKVDANSRVWYYDGQTARFDLNQTTDYGNGGIINVPAGLNEVVAKLGDKVVARTSASVRAGYMTIVVLAPLDTAQAGQ